MDSSIKMDTDALRKAVLDLQKDQLDPLENSHVKIGVHAPLLIQNHPNCDSYQPLVTDWIADADAKIATLSSALQDSANRLKSIVDLFETIDGESQEAWDAILKENPALFGNEDLMAMTILGMTAEQMNVFMEYGFLLQAREGHDLSFLLSFLQSSLFAEFAANDPYLQQFLFPPGVSDQAIGFIAQFETLGKITSPPTDILDGNCTGGYGHVLHNGKCTKTEKAMNVDQPLAVQWMRLDLAKSENTIRQYVRVPLSQQQYDALVSAVYNGGQYIFKDSETGEPTQLLIDLNNGDYAAAAKDLLDFHYTLDKETKKYVSLPSLLRRRKEEKEMWEDGNYTVDSASKWK